MSAGVKGTKGKVINLTIPQPVWARISTAAESRWSSPTEYLRRFLIDNLDALDPPEATTEHA